MWVRDFSVEGIIHADPITSTHTSTQQLAVRLVAALYLTCRSVFLGLLVSLWSVYLHLWLATVWMELCGWVAIRLCLPPNLTAVTRQWHKSHRPLWDWFNPQNSSNRSLSRKVSEHDTLSVTRVWELQARLQWVVVVIPLHHQCLALSPVLWDGRTECPSDQDCVNMWFSATLSHSGAAGLGCWTCFVNFTLQISVFVVWTPHRLPEILVVYYKMYFS